MCLLGAAVSSLQLADPWDEARAYRGFSSHLIYYVLLSGSLSLSLALSLPNGAPAGTLWGVAVQCM